MSSFFNQDQVIHFRSVRKRGYKDSGRIIALFFAVV